jgi:hypothetical protein
VNIPDRAEVWEKVIRKLRTGAMPPAGLPRPGQATADSLASYLERKIDDAIAAHPRPGRTEPIHRLNRAEYQNSIRDLLMLEIDSTALLPADDQSYGFDNIAGVLKMSPTLLERYMGAARAISRLAVGASKPLPTAETFRVPSDRSQYEQLEGLPFGSRGGTAIRYNFPRDGEYVIKAELLDLFAGAQVREPHQLEIAVDGERAKVFTLTPKPRANGDAATPAQPSAEEQAAVFGSKPPEFQVRIPIKAGLRLVTVTFIAKTAALPESLRQPFSRPHGEGDYLMYEPHLGAVTIAGPFDPHGVPETRSRARIFTCHPAAPADEPACAKQILSSLARRAYRRPVSDEDLAPLMALYKQGRAAGGFDSGIEEALRAVLVSPDFLYRVETDPVAASNGAPPAVTPNGVHRLSDLELASRLSFFCGAAFRTMN